MVRLSWLGEEARENVVPNINYSVPSHHQLEDTSPKSADLENPYSCKDRIPLLAIYQHSADKYCFFSVLRSPPHLLFFLIKLSTL